MLPSLQLNDNKAGMSGLDTKRINEIIQATSAGSKYYNHQIKRQQKIDERIVEMKQKLDSFSKEQIENSNKQMDKFLIDFEVHRNLSQTIVHIDMDAFYAAVETRDDPALKEKPMAVGGSSMLSTSNYIARRFGVRAAMPGFIAKKLCPELVIVPLNFDKYRAVSKEVQSVFRQYDPDFSAMSLDEAYLNITDYLSQVNDDTSLDHQELAEKVVREMREKIFQKTQLTSSAGIASNCLLAKICSDQNKPNGQFYLPSDRDAILNFMAELPVRKVCGIGNQTEQLLKALNVSACKDFIANRGILALLFSSISSKWFMKVALGIGSTTVRNDEPRKSLSTERTFSETSDEKQLHTWCSEFSNELANELKSEELLAKTITLKLKTSQFDVKTRSVTLSKFISDAEEIFTAAKQLLDKEIAATRPQQLMLRLMGVRVSGLVHQSVAQGGILSFLQGDIKTQRSPEKEHYRCPVCSEEFPSLHLLNDHLDNCVAEGIPSECKNDPAKQDTLDSAGRSKYHPDSTAKLKLEFLLDDRTLMEPSQYRDSLCETKVSCESASTSSSESAVLSCPVCHRTNFSTESDVDDHLDVCLNSNIVQELRQAGFAHTAKRPIEKNCHANKRKKTCHTNMKIDSYFTKK